MLNDLLFLLEASGEQIRQYYKFIPEKEYYEILKADPTSIVKNNEVKKVGKYSKHCLEIYKRNPYQVSQLVIALKTWEDNKKDIKEQFTKMKTITDIMETAQNANESSLAAKESKIVFKSGDILVRQILSRRAAIYYGNYCGHGKVPNKFQSNWCTSYPEGSYYDSSYSKSKGKLFIIMKKNGELLAQAFYGKSMDEIRDNENEPIELSNISLSVAKYFDKKFPSVTYSYYGRKFKSKMKNGIIVFGDLLLEHLNLESLKDLPWVNKKWICDGLFIGNNKLSNLEGLENLIRVNHIHCQNNKINTLKHLTAEFNVIHLDNNELTKLDFVKIPKTITVFNANNNKLKEVDILDKINIDKTHLRFSHNYITRLPKSVLNKTSGVIDFSYNKIKEKPKLKEKNKSTTVDFENNPFYNKNFEYLSTNLKTEDGTYLLRITKKDDDKHELYLKTPNQPGVYPEYVMQIKNYNVWEKIIKKLESVFKYDYEKIVGYEPDIVLSVVDFKELVFSISGHEYAFDEDPDGSGSEQEGPSMPWEFEIRIPGNINSTSKVLINNRNAEISMKLVIDQIEVVRDYAYEESLASIDWG